MQFASFTSIMGFLLPVLFSPACRTGTAPTEADAAAGPAVLLKAVARDTVLKPAFPHYDSISYVNVQKLAAAPGTKSVLFTGNGSRLYAMNLEGMSVYEYDAEARTRTRSFHFKPTPGKGWDYERDKVVPSYEEKPVEACLSKDEETLWVSLHNAGGIVGLPLGEANKTTTGADSSAKKTVYVWNKVTGTKDSVYVPLIHTGATPKVIARTGNDSFVLVSNWHGLSVSVLQRTDEAPNLRKLTDIKAAAIPRGIAVDDVHQKTYVAIMGSNTLSVIDNATWQKEPDLPVAANPRHVVIDSEGRLFVSFNKLAKIACVDPLTRTTLFTAATAAQPRSLVLSRNGRFLFVTCYNGNAVGVYKIEEDKFRLLFSLPCAGKPVGIDVRETADTLEAWVCNYVGGSLSIFTFKKWAGKEGVTSASL